jgi:hypothetical protein
VLDILSELALIHENVKGLLPNIRFVWVMGLIRKKYTARKKKIKESGREIDRPVFPSLKGILSRVRFHILRRLNYRYLGRIGI